MFAGKHTFVYTLYHVDKYRGHSALGGWRHHSCQLSRNLRDSPGFLPFVPEGSRMTFLTPIVPEFGAAPRNCKLCTRQRYIQTSSPGRRAPPNSLQRSGSSLVIIIYGVSPCCTRERATTTYVRARAYMQCSHSKSVHVRYGAAASRN